MPLTQCRQCGSQIEYDDEHAGMEVECGACHTTFIAGQDDQPPRRKRRHYLADCDWEDFDRDPEYYYEEARQLVKNPGLWLIVGNCLSIVLIIGSVTFLIFVFAAMNTKGAGPGLPPGLIWFYVLFMGIFGVIEVVRAVLGFLGGRALSGLKSQKMAMTGAIASLIPIQGLMSVIYFPFGIWALVTIQKPVVKWAFDRNRKRES